MHTFFISDLHLEDSRPEVTEIFLRFLKEQAVKADALYILGDFFEFWVGDDDNSSLARSVRGALRAVTEQGLPVYMLHGNRDFLLRKRFFRATGCQLMGEETVIDLYRVPTLLMHGDTLCREDVAYLKARRYVRNRLVQMLFLWKSFQKRQAIAAKHRAASQVHTRSAPAYVLDVTQAEVERVMLKHGVKHLIHGHTHKPARHTFLLKGQPATRTVLGDWGRQGNALVCYADGRQEFVALV